MNIWIVNQYAITPYQAGGTRHYSLAKEMVGRGHKVTIMASSFDHGSKRELHLAPGERYKIEYIDGIRFFWMRTPSYFGNSLARVWNMLCFGFRAWRWPSRCLGDKPDVIVGSSPHLFAALSAELLASRKRVPFVFEVRDLWPQTLVDLGDLSRYHPFVIALGILERYLYRRAARIISLLSDSADHMVAKGADRSKFVWIPNGIDMDLVGPIKDMSSKVPAKVIYAGAHGLANALDIVIQSAQILSRQGWADRIKFILIGDGPEKVALIQKAEQMGLTNVLFEDPVPKNKIYNRLKDADILLMTFLDSTLYRWGISPNKIFDYMASARPILLCVSASQNPVLLANAGFVIPPGDATGLAEAIIKVSATPYEELKQMGLRGRRYVEEFHSMRRIGRVLEDTLNEVVK